MSSSLFDLAFRQNEWLAKRETVIASNIVNANTPGYQAKDLASFEQVMRGSLPLSATDRAHFSQGGPQAVEARIENTNPDTVLPSGNDVSLEQEFLKSGEVMRNYSMNSQIIKAFHRMVLAAAKA